MTAIVKRKNPCTNEYYNHAYLACEKHITDFIKYETKTDDWIYV